MSNGTKILTFSAFLIMGVVGYVIITMGNKGGADQQIATPAAAASTPVVPPKEYKPPTLPPLTLSQPVVAGKDIFAGGPPPPRIYVPPPPPATVTVPAVPMAIAKKDQMRWRPLPGVGPVVTSKALPFGRLAGWIFNNQGQVIALFEDENGVVRTVGVGDEIGGLRVKALAHDHMTLVDDSTGRETRIKLQGLDTYQRKAVTVDAQPMEGGAVAPTYPGEGGGRTDGGDGWMQPPPM